MVGGSVRDFLLKRPVKDHDIATSANPTELLKLFPRAITVGKAFGVLKVPTSELGDETPGRLLEIATFREDLEYTDHRHPASVRFATPVEDARRRDFTVNALFYDPKTNRILDSVGGMADLKSRVLRAIGDPEERFSEDALRLLRAVRFTANLDFELESETARAIELRGKLIGKVSAERIRDEINGMLKGPRAAYAFMLLSTLGLLKLILPELETLKGVKQIPVYHGEGDVWSRTLKVLQILAEEKGPRSLTLMWAALLHDTGKPEAAKKSDGKNFNGHEIDGALISKRVGERLKFPREEIERIQALIEDSLKMRDLFKMREATLQRLVREPYFPELLSLHRAQAIAADGNLACYEFGLSRLQALPRDTAEQKLLDGNDLIQLGLSPGRGFSEILRAVEDLRLENKLLSKDEALEYVIRNFVK